MEWTAPSPLSSKSCLQLDCLKARFECGLYILPTLNLWKRKRIGSASGYLVLVSQLRYSLPLPWLFGCTPRDRTRQTKFFYYRPVKQAQRQHNRQISSEAKLHIIHRHPLQKSSLQIKTLNQVNHLTLTESITRRRTCQWFNRTLGDQDYSRSHQDFMTFSLIAPISPSLLRIDAVQRRQEEETRKIHVGKQWSWSQ